MLKKIFVGILLFTVIGAGLTALVTRTMAKDEQDATAQSPIIAEGEITDPQQINAQLNTQENQEQPWQADGTIIDMDDNGLTLATADGEEVYVELGPADFWQAQGNTPVPGMQVAVEGSETAGMIHAYRLTFKDGQTLELRNELGQPLWSGGVEHGQGQVSGQMDGTQNPEPKAEVDEWVTITATLMAYQGGSMTVSTDEGEMLSIQTGQPRFFAQQGVSFAVGDALSLVGYYEGEQFVVGEITQVESGLRVMLRDPNGRPLWAGPGNGSGNGNGNGRQNQ